MERREARGSVRKVKTSVMSEKLLFKRFVTEFNEHLKKMMKGQPGKMTEEEVEHMLRVTGFIFTEPDPSKMEREMRLKSAVYSALKEGALGVEPSSLRVFLAAVMGFSFDWMVSDDVSKLDGRYGGFDGRDRFRFANKRDIKVVKREFAELGKSRAEFVKDVIKFRQWEKIPREKLFHPEINEKSS